MKRELYGFQEESNRHSDMRGRGSGLVVYEKKRIKDRETYYNGN